MSDKHTINQNIVLEKESGVERDNILLIPLRLVFYYRQQRIDSHNILIIPQYVHNNKENIRKRPASWQRPQLAYFLMQQ